MLSSCATRSKSKSTRNGKRRIVLLDDHAESRKIVSHVLQARGVSCTCAETVSAALAAIVDVNPHAILFEWDLRGTGETDLVSKLRGAAVARCAEPLLIVVSALDEPDGFRKSAGIDAYFTKPVDIEELLRALRGRH